MREDQDAGPQLGQTVLYNNSGTLQAAVIAGVNANGTVSLTTFPAGSSPSTASSVVYNPSADTVSGTWRYPMFL